MDDVEIALLNAQDAIDEVDGSFHPGTRTVVVFRSDLKVLMDAARKGLNGKDH
ncbi:Hypothetical Protein OBI_RACECAR_257 [Arthrobacter phage Racecar]|nr:hypothetical protein PBI_RACECAR_49 [Arthrobacter phage Racecar]QFG12733.1 hypothetical protein PBI_MIMI_49 [Arthrobacter phage Mimi]